MAQGSWSATAATSEIVAANEYRDKLFIQLTAGDATALGFGTAAVFGEGIQLVNVGDNVVVRGDLARRAVNAICDSGNSSDGGYQDGSGG